MQSSKMLSTGRGSNLRIDMARLTMSSQGEAGEDVFRRTKGLGPRKSSQDDGLVHRIRAIQIACSVTTSVGAAVYDALGIIQIRRTKRGGNEAVIGLSDEQVNPDKILWENRFDIANDVDAGSGMANRDDYHWYIPFPGDDYMEVVEPLWLDGVLQVLTLSSGTISITWNVWLYYIPVRLAMDKYEKVLNAYTQAPSFFDRQVPRT